MLTTCSQHAALRKTAIQRSVRLAHPGRSITSSRKSTSRSALPRQGVARARLGETLGLSSNVAKALNSSSDRRRLLLLRDLRHHMSSIHRCPAAAATTASGTAGVWRPLRQLSDQLTQECSSAGFWRTLRQQSELLTQERSSAGVWSPGQRHSH